MTDLRQAAERALRAMEAIEHKVDSRYFSEEITALCLAIAETEQPERNLELEIALAEKGLGPIAWGIFLEHKGKWGLLQRVYDSEEFAKSSSIGFETGELAVTGGLKFDASQIDVRPLYTAPTPRKPWVGLTVEEIFDCTHHITRIQQDEWVATDDDLCEFADTVAQVLKKKNGYGTWNKPLSKEQIDNICKSFRLGYTDEDLVRAIERAHGIGDSNE